MNKFEHLDNLITESYNSFDPEEIIEVSSIEELMELSTVGGIAGHAGTQSKPPFSSKKTIQKFNKDEERRQRLKEIEEGINNMNNRQQLIIEQQLRTYVRKKIKSLMHQQQKSQMVQEQQLRLVIRQLLKEGDISDIHPHRSTGINVLEDLLKKMVPTLRTDFKRLTTDESQRKSFRAHMVKAIKDSLMPMMVNDKFKPTGGADPTGGALLSEPTEDEPKLDLGAEEEPALDVPAPEEDAEGEEDEAALAALEEAVLEELGKLDELDIDVTPEDGEKKIPIEKDDTPSEEEAFGAGLEGLDETGRNMAFTCFKKVSQYILDAYDSLANPKDKEIFIDYLITNVKLYFDKFESEIAKTVDEPTTDEYESAKT